MNKDNRLGNGAIIVLLIGSLFAARLIMLFQSPWPNGLDGAYYAMEFRSFMERGHLENPDLSPVFRIGGLISLLTGDPVASVKICSALLSAVLTGGMYLLLRIIKPEKPDAAWLAATLTSLSPSLSKMSVNYLNNMGGLAFGILALSFTALYQKKRRWLYLSASLLFLVTAIFSHRVTAVYLFVVFVFLAAAFFFTGAFFLAGAFFTVLAFAALACAFSAFPTAFVSFSNFYRSFNAIYSIGSIQEESLLRVELTCFDTG